MPVAARGGGQTNRRQSARAGLNNPGINQRLWGLIVTYSEQLRLDPYAVAAVSRVEGGGRFGAVGDAGTSYGPFQLHVGGALPPGRTAAWANSPQGVFYAMSHMAAAGAAGLRGRAAISAIVTRFERPANPGREIQAAWGGAGTGNFQFAPNAGGGVNWQQMVLAQKQIQNQFAQSQTTLLDQLKQQAAQSRQQAMAQSAVDQLLQRHQAAQQSQMQLVGQPAAGLAADPTTNLLDLNRSRVDALRSQALRGAGL